MKKLEAYKGNELSLYTDNVLNCLNHKKRGVLGGKCSCLVFFGSEKLNVTRRDRKEIYEWIIEQKLEIREELGDEERPSGDVNERSRLILTSPRPQSSGHASIL